MTTTVFYHFHDLRVGLNTLFKPYETRHHRHMKGRLLKYSGASLR